MTAKMEWKRGRGRGRGRAIARGFHAEVGAGFSPRWSQPVRAGRALLFLSRRYESIIVLANTIKKMDGDDGNDDFLLEGLSAESFFREKQNESDAREAAAAAVIAEKENKALAKELERERAAEYKNNERMRREAQKNGKKKTAAPLATVRIANADGDTDSLYGDEATPIIGKKTRELLTKVRQYKQLFNDNDAIKKFKIKKNANEEDLQTALDEMDSIVNTNTIDDFLTDAILTCIKMVEGISVRSTNYNITGLADMLKASKEFNNLTRQCLIKYGVFAAVPPETQLIFIIATSAYICTAKNSKKVAINAFLDRPPGSA